MFPPWGDDPVPKVKEAMLPVWSLYGSLGAWAIACRSGLLSGSKWEPSVFDTRALVAGGMGHVRFYRVGTLPAVVPSDGRQRCRHYNGGIVHSASEGQGRQRFRPVWRGPAPAPQRLIEMAGSYEPCRSARTPFNLGAVTGTWARCHFMAIPRVPP